MMYLQECKIPHGKEGHSQDPSIDSFFFSRDLFLTSKNDSNQSDVPSSQQHYHSYKVQDREILSFIFFYNSLF